MAQWVRVLLATQTGRLKFKPQHLCNSWTWWSKPIRPVPLGAELVASVTFAAGLQHNFMLSKRHYPKRLCEESSYVSLFSLSVPPLLPPSLSPLSLSIPVRVLYICLLLLLMENQLNYFQKLFHLCLLFCVWSNEAAEIVHPLVRDMSTGEACVHGEIKKQWHWSEVWIRLAWRWEIPSLSNI